MGKRRILSYRKKSEIRKLKMRERRAKNKDTDCLFHFQVNFRTKSHAVNNFLRESSPLQGQYPIGLRDHDDTVVESVGPGEPSPSPGESPNAESLITPPGSPSICGVTHSDVRLQSDSLTSRVCTPPSVPLSNVDCAGQTNPTDLHTSVCTPEQRLPLPTSNSLGYEFSEKVAENGRTPNIKKTKEQTNDAENKNFITKNQLSRKFNLDSLPDKTAVPPKATGSFSCRFCERKFTKHSLTAHKRHCLKESFSHPDADEWGKNAYRCENCGESFNEFSELTDHMSNCSIQSFSHADERGNNMDGYRCENCGESFNEFSQLTDHMSNCSIQVEILPEMGNPNNEALNAQNELQMLKAQEEARNKRIKNRQNKNYINPITLTLRPAIEQISYQVKKKADLHRMYWKPTTFKKPGRSSNNQRASLETTASQSSSVDPSVTSATAYPTGLFKRNSSVDKTIKQCVICGKIFSSQVFLTRHMFRKHKDCEKSVESSSHGNPGIDLPDQGQDYMQQQTTFVQEHIDHYNRAQEIRLSDSLQIFTNKRIDQSYIPNGVVEPAFADTSNLLSPMISDTQMNNISINNNSTDLNVKEPSVTDKLNQILRDGTLRGSQSIIIKTKTAEQVTQVNDSMETVALGSDEEGELWECDFCVKRFLMEDYLLIHIMTKHPKEWNKSNKRRVLLSHNANKSQALPPEKEHVPGKRKTRTKRPAIVHEPSTETIESPSILTPFMSRIAFSKHSNIVLECTHCEQTFVNATRLNYHIATSHNI